MTKVAWRFERQIADLRQSSAQKSDFLRREVCKIRKYRRHRAARDSEPGGKRGTVLIDRGCGYPASARVGVVRAGKFEGGKSSVDLTSLHGPAQHHVMASPGVVGAVACRRLERATEIRFGVRRHVLGHAQFLSGRIERCHRLTHLRV